MTRHRSRRSLWKFAVTALFALMAMARSYAQVSGSGLMSKQEILDYVRAHAFVDGKPTYDQQVCKDVVERIKLRGVDFSGFDYATDDLRPLSGSGCNIGKWAVDSAAKLNRGPPAQQHWLMGKWNVAVIGGTTDRVHRDGYVYRKEESGARIGLLRLNPDSTYVWQMLPQDPPSAFLRGRWRPATPDEMGLQGGAGVVLERAEAGQDWIVLKRFSEHGPDLINIQNLQGRGQQRVASRG